MVDAMLLKYSLITSLFVCSFWGYNHYFEPKRTFTIEECQAQYPLLKERYSNNKIFFPKIELAALVALSFFPELKDTPIEFVSKDTKTTMATRPKICSVFKKKDKREYRIYVDDALKGSYGILVKDVPFNALIGLIAHELEHVMDYESMSGGQIIGLGFKYGRSKFKEKFEKDTDLRTMKRGLAWQLYDWSKFAMEDSDANQAYKDYKKQYYLEPAEIQAIIEAK